MYEALKHILPHNILKNNEASLRRIIYMFYKGNSKQCPICQKKLKKFVQLNNGDDICPYCASLPRHRRLWLLLQPLLLTGTKILDFSPPRCLYQKLKAVKSIRYTATDFAHEFTADRSFDITNIDLPPNSIDLIVCYHVLEHVNDDEKAMAELYRILKPGGPSFIQTPFKEGDIYENVSIQTKEGRKQHFGQEDHVRIYSLEGLKERLQKQGFKVEVLSFAEAQNNFFGLSATEYILKATK